MRGEYVLYPGTPQEITLPNMLTDEGEEFFLKMICQDDQSKVAGAGNFYIGLCADTPAESSTLVGLTGEPGATGSYARQPITRDATGWPVVAAVSGTFRAQTANVTFQPVSVSYDTAIDRLFLCNVLSGAGVLFSMSGAMAAPIIVSVAVPLVAQYNLYLD